MAVNRSQRSRPARQSALPTGKSAPNRRRATRSGPRFGLTFSLPAMGGVQKALTWALGSVMAVVIVGGISFGLLYGYRYLTVMPYFSVKSIEVTGNFRLTSREVLDTAGLDVGMNALAVSLSDVERRLGHSPWITGVSARRELPDRFFIHLTEIEPHFWVRKEGVLYYADVTGREIAAVSPDKFTSFPTLEVEKGAEAMTAVLPDLIRSLSREGLTVDMGRVSLVRLSPGRGMEVFLADNNMVLSIGQEDWSRNLDRLEAVMADLQRRGEIDEVREIRAHDVSVLVVKDRPVTASGRPHGGGNA